ncbi:PAS domain S-box protein [Pirellula sp. SH-Sr6A]|uniref:PAS domain S-box protein n=1 Tax=Pirellula sp. SH-Sr6A TaxID=1632865 RepID=UPI0011BAE164|nr:PAS domain S-box protein [Pirellula sp. SH-Sr6A]
MQSKLPRSPGPVRGGLLHRHLSEFIAMEDREANEIQFRKLQSRDISSYECELQFQRVAGEPVWVRQIAARLNGQSKGVAEVVVLAKDISKRKLDDSRIAADLQAMTKLQGIGAMFVRGRDAASVLDAIVDAAISINSASFGNIQLFHEKSCTLTVAAHRGFHPSCKEFWNPLTRDGVAHREALQHGNRVIISDIEENPARFSPEAIQEQREAGIRSLVATPLTSRTERHLGVFTTYYQLPHTPDERNLTLLDLLARQAADIIDRQEAEAILHDRDERLQSILDAASDSIVCIDSQGFITSINAATEKMFGYQREELIGKNVKILMPDPYSEQHDTYIRRYLQTGVPHVIGTGREAIAKRKDGTTFPIDLAVSEMDHLHLFTGIIRDISERKSLQHDILAIADEEQRRIRQDLHDSVQQELAAAGLVTQTLLRYLDRHHDALPTSFTASCKSLAEKIFSSISRAHREVREISTGLVSLPHTPTALVDSLRELAARTDEIEGIHCAFACDTPGKTISIDATHLYRIAQEAVTNALKHSQPEHILIKLTTDESQHTLEIADDGKGFDTNLQASGMGIKTMRYRAGLIGGTLSICPVENGGTLVCCRIPRNHDANDKQRIER